jgi:hypothetical protein
MCGSTNLLKENGVFTCQSCGTKYSVEEARKMMVEGTVSVKGTVAVDKTGFIGNYLVMASNASQAGNYAEAEKLLTQTVENVGLNIEETVTDIIKQSDKIPKEIKDDIGKVNGISATIKIKIDKSAWDKFQKENSSKLFENMIISGGTGNYQFAEGGFPTQGELFVAREAGPELVGTMNGRTAVANNDQIVKGIEQASYQGMMKALNSAGGKNVTVNINAEGDASGLLNFINFKQNQEARRNGM